MKYIVTGGAGFIGSHIIDRLLKNNNEVICLDNLSTGKLENIKHNEGNKNFKFIVKDLLEFQGISEIFRGSDAIFHFAANADIRGGVAQPRKDLELNTIVTYNVLEGMRLANVKKIIFSSSSAVYGEPEIYPTCEDYPLIPTSLYGASKIACEALISAYCASFNLQAWIFRFVGVIGARHSHGVIFDFVNKLKMNPKELEIIGNGEQVKSFLALEDCIDGIMFAYEKANKKINIYNLGTDEDIKIKKLADIVVEELNLKNVKYRFTGGIRGWVGDAPVVRLSIERIKKLGWEPRTGIEEAIRRTVRWLKR
ncbi:MAG: NAD-dependent epimerase/dehydratase family protein [Candidatus Thermoplasmatota archaeon]|nr:NAD-dependent epimerase/dehydratase family protein [Candidatus Thermoplasmatota archaeon]